MLQLSLKVNPLLKVLGPSKQSDRNAKFRDLVLEHWNWANRQNITIILFIVKTSSGDWRKNEMQVLLRLKCKCKKWRCAKLFHVGERVFGSKNVYSGFNLLTTLTMQRKETYWKLVCTRVKIKAYLPLKMLNGFNEGNRLKVFLYLFFNLLKSIFDDDPFVLLNPRSCLIDGNVALSVRFQSRQVKRSCN